MRKLTNSPKTSQTASPKRNSLQAQLVKQKAANKRLRLRGRLTKARHYEKYAHVSLIRELVHIAEIGTGEE